jgi:hypothetical protein
MTFVTLVSRICMNATTITVKVMAHLWALEIGGDSGAGGVIGSSRSVLQAAPSAAQPSR